MMRITYAAKQPVSKGKPMDQTLYSLSSLVTLVGGTWPPSCLDITVTNFTCTTTNDVLVLEAEVDIHDLPVKSVKKLTFLLSLTDSQLQLTDVLTIFIS
jgi:hypothetical protein